MGWGDWLSAKGDQFRTLPGRVADDISAFGARPASPELMQRYMDDISALLPESRVKVDNPRRLPYYASRAEGGAVEEAPKRSLVERAWEARPWKDQLNKPTDYAPLTIALGLLHPRLGGAMRDMNMAAALANKGHVSAGLGHLPLGRPTSTGIQHLDDGLNVTVQSNGVLAAKDFNALPLWRRDAANVNNRSAMQPKLSAVPSEQLPTAAQSPYKPGSRVAQYEAHLVSLERAGVPYEQFPTWQAFFRGLDGKADGGPVEKKPEPSFSGPLSGFIDKVVGGVKDYGRGAMDRAGWAPWAKGAGEVAMGVAATPFEAVSSASKLAMAPADWATGREVMASPLDVVGALPIAATGGLKALRHALDVSDLKRGARATEDFLTTKRDGGDFLPADARIKQIIDDMAARRNMD